MKSLLSSPKLLKELKRKGTDFLEEWLSKKAVGSVCRTFPADWRKSTFGKRFENSGMPSAGPDLGERIFFGMPDRQFVTLEIDTTTGCYPAVPADCHMDAREDAG